MNNALLDGSHPADTVVPALPPSWRAELYAGLGDDWNADADADWLMPEDDN